MKTARLYTRVLRTSLAILVNLFVVSTYAQNTERCLTDQFHAEAMEDPAYAEAYHNRMDKVAKYLKAHKDLAKAECEELLYIPVAVHFEDVTIDHACAVEMALSQVERLNTDFSGTNTDLSKFTDHQAIWPGINNKASCIRFCLATLSHPDGSGIVEGDYAVTVNQYDNTTDNLPEWAGYLNFYVRTTMPGGTLGYSVLGGTGNGDGVVIGLTYFGSVSCGGNTIDATYSLGRTATHEVGHYLSLDHPFGNDCVTDNDGIADTPITNAATYGCYDDGEEIINCTDPILWPDYMDYANDACMYLFTEGQIDQVEAYVNTSLENLINSATIRCQDAACINYEVSLNHTNESCAGNDANILLGATGGTEPYQYSINNGVAFSDLGDFTSLQEGKYYIIVTDQGGCEYIDSVEITRAQPTMEVINQKAAFCGDNSGALTVKVNYADEFLYQIEGVTGWQDTTYFSNLTGGQYIVTAVNETNCTSSVQVTIEDKSDLNIIAKSVTPVNCPRFDNGEIILGVANAVEPVIWQLDDNPPTDAAVFDGLSPGEYLVQVDDGRGCHSEQIFRIGLSYLEIGDDCPCQVYIPNAMTPDGDGLNDLLDIIPSCPITEFQLQVFDRIGNLIFTSTSVDKKWNGGAGNYFVPPGVYPYVVQFRWGLERNESLEVETLRGYITIVR